MAYGGQESNSEKDGNHQSHPGEPFAPVHQARNERGQGNWHSQHPLHSAQVHEQVGSGGVACGRILAQHFGDDPIQLSRNLGIELAGRRRILIQDAAADGHPATGAEGMAACKRFVENDAERKEVRALVYFLLEQDLRGHIGRRARQAAGVNLQRGRTSGGLGLQGDAFFPAGQQLGHTEIENLDLAGRGEHHVFRLDVAVNNSALVSGDERLSALNCDGQKLLQAHRLGEALAQRVAFDVFHDHKDLVVFLEHVVHAGDMGVGQTGGVLRLAEKPFAILLVGAEFGCDPLESYRALQQGIIGLVNLTHAAAPQPGADAKAAHGSAGQVPGR